MISLYKYPDFLSTSGNTQHKKKKRKKMVEPKKDSLKSNDTFKTTGDRKEQDEKQLDVQMQTMDDEGMTNQHYIEKDLRKENSWKDVKKSA